MLWFTSRVIQSFSSRVSVPPSLSRLRNMYAFEPARLSSAGTSHDTNLYAIWFILFCFAGGFRRPDFYAVIRFRIRDMFPFISFSICPWYGVFLLHTPRLCTTSMRFRDTSIVSIRLPSIVAESMSESAFR